ncbi:MAG: alpha/beta hydrolase-fold protein [Acetobacteraceae bacterium]
MLTRRALLGTAAAASLAAPGRADDWRVLPDGCVTADGTWLPYNVFLPSGFRRSAGRYRLLVLLHGANADEQFWAGRLRLWRAVEAAVAAGRIGPLIAVMPGSRDTWWVDSRAARAESALVRDLLADVALKYPVTAAREGRAIAGYSAGGYGALRIALKHPHLFGAAALWAPAAYAETPPPLSAARRSAAFAGEDGAFDQEAWRRAAWPALLPAYVAQRLRVPMFIAAGEVDPLGIAGEAMRLGLTLGATQPGLVALRFVEAGHTMRVWEETVDEALEFLFGGQGQSPHPIDVAAAR